MPATVQLAERIQAENRILARKLRAPFLDDPKGLSLVGRDQERARLVRAVEWVLNGAGGMALVEEEAGLSRSQLLDSSGQVVGCVAVDQNGRFGLMAVYGRDREAGIPGYQAGEILRLLVGACVQEAGFAWQNDRTPYRVDVALNGQGCQVSGESHRLFLPWASKSR